VESHIAALFAIGLAGSAIGTVSALRLSRFLVASPAPGSPASAPAGTLLRSLPPALGLLGPIAAAGLLVVMEVVSSPNPEMMSYACYVLALASNAIPLLAIVFALATRFPQQTLRPIGAAVPLGIVFSFISMMIFGQVLEFGWLDWTPLGIMGDPYRMMAVFLFLPFWSAGVVGLFVAIGCRRVRREQAEVAP
jgi:hypothetical protein